MVSVGQTMVKKKNKIDVHSQMLMNQATTFKSIRSLQPLLDRILVQRFKAETVS